MGGQVGGQVGGTRVVRGVVVAVSILLRGARCGWGIVKPGVCVRVVVVGGGEGGVTFLLLRRDMPSSGSMGMGCVACVIGAAKRLARDATWLGVRARG